MRSVTTKPVSFTHKLMMQAEQQGCDCEKKEGETRKTLKSIALQPDEDAEDKACSDEELTCCRPYADPWKRPECMDEETFERYVAETVGILEPVIPLNPFAGERPIGPPGQETGGAEPEADPEQIRDELERLLAAIDYCPSEKCSTCPMDIGSCSCCQ